MALTLQTIRTLILDMDGVLWRGETPMPGLAEFFATLRELDIGFVLATNNATKVATQYTEKLARFGVAVAPEQILTSSEATAAYLRGRYAAGASTYAVGEVGLRFALEDAGFSLLPAGGLVSGGTQVDVVVVGLNRDACWEQLASAAYLVNQGALFVGTNGDVSFPTEMGPLPGAGALVAMVEAATGVKPVIVGKPSPAMFEEALRRLDAKRETTVMVGDRLETDIAGAKSVGLRTLLVLSGVTTRERLLESDIQPDAAINDIGSLASALREAHVKEVNGR
jgi:4-nitrophenyl phosphatase